MADLPVEASVVLLAHGAAVASLLAGVADDGQVFLTPTRHADAAGVDRNFVLVAAFLTMLAAQRKKEREPDRMDGNFLQLGCLEQPSARCAQRGPVIFEIVECVDDLDLLLDRVEGGAELAQSREMARLHLGSDLHGQDAGDDELVFAAAC